MISDLLPIGQSIRAECREDYVGLWSIVRRIRDAGVPEPCVITKTTLALLTQLLADGEFSAGQFVDQEFDKWDMLTQEVIAKIDRDWTSLGRDPNIGEIAWFVAELPT